MKIKNAKTLPKVYFGLHMVEGVAEYRDPAMEPYRIFIGEKAIKNMDPTFSGKPVYVGHVDEVNVDNIQAEADGYVVRSFFNKADGKHWVEFIVVSDRGHEAIRNGWRLSNAYVPKNFSNGGLWHGVEYLKEVNDGEYEHLAIVQNPRYEESIILTPEEFKLYNDQKEQELKRLANEKEKKSKGEGMFKFFKKEKVENSADLESMSVTLPKSGKELTLTQVINKADEVLANGYHCNGDETVKVGEESMSVNQLIEKHMEMKNTLAAMEEEKKNQAAEDEKKNEDEKPEDKKENEDQVEDEKKNEVEDEKKNEEEEEKKKNSLDNFNKLKNAQHKASKIERVGELSEDRVARGKAKYGSN